MKDLNKLASKFEEFRQLAAELKLIKKNELKLRKEICEELLKGKQKGTHSFEVDGMTIKAVKKVNFKLDNDILEHLSELSPEEQGMINIKPSLALSAYNKSTADTNALDEFITVTPATPTLEVYLG